MGREGQTDRQTDTERERVRISLDVSFLERKKWGKMEKMGRKFFPYKKIKNKNERKRKAQKLLCELRQKKISPRKSRTGMALL